MADPNLYVNEFKRITAGLRKYYQKVIENNLKFNIRRLLRKPNLQEVVEGYGMYALHYIQSA